MSKSIYLIGHCETGYQFGAYPTTDPYEHFPDYYKIGVADDPEKRLSGLKSGSPHKLKLITTIESRNPRSVERILHRMYRHYEKRSEWFNLMRNDVNSLVALNQLEPSDLEPLADGAMPSWKLEDTSLYLEVERVRRGGSDD